MKCGAIYINEWGNKQALVDSCDNAGYIVRTPGATLVFGLSYNYFWALKSWICINVDIDIFAQRVKDLLLCVGF